MLDKGLEWLIEDWLSLMKTLILGAWVFLGFMGFKEFNLQPSNFVSQLCYIDWLCMYDLLILMIL